jgi:carboxymethylenebutenolidase
MLTTPRDDAPIHWAVPGSRGPHPAVLLFHEAFGVNEHTVDVAARLAAEGFVVAAPSFLHRLGVDAIPYDEHERAVGLIGMLTADDIIDDAQRAYRAVQARDDVDGARVAALGFCFGGRCAYLAATELDLAASVSFYGVGIAAADGSGLLGDAKPRTPMLFVFGDADPLIPEAARATIAEVVVGDDARHEMVTYGGAGHAFFNDARPDRHDPVAAAQAWACAIGFLRRHTAVTAD